MMHALYVFHRSRRLHCSSSPPHSTGTTVNGRVWQLAAQIGRSPPSQIGQCHTRGITPRAHTSRAHASLPHTCRRRCIRQVSPATQFSSCNFLFARSRRVPFVRSRSQRVERHSEWLIRIAVVRAIASHVTSSESSCVCSLADYSASVCPHSSVESFLPTSALSSPSHCRSLRVRRATGAGTQVEDRLSHGIKHTIERSIERAVLLRRTRHATFDSTRLGSSQLYSSRRPTVNSPRHVVRFGFRRSLEPSR
jgi:hypothetical protein